ncbi:hypothetical protein ABE10_01845 [Bacillus toyonensis]|nr:hypothetical protein [Bacillus toyonensis]
MSDPRRSESEEQEPDVVPSEAGNPNRDRAYLRHQPPVQDRTDTEGAQAGEDAAEPPKRSDE